MASAEAPSFIPSGEIPGKKPEAHLTYNPDFDTKRYLELLPLKTFNPEAYMVKKVLLDSEVLFNLNTMLGERYNAGLSTRTDRIVNGDILGTHSDEPLLEVFKRGRDYRAEKSSAHDRKRENAEIVGFEKIQSVLTDEQTAVGTIMVSISPAGGEESDYKHNFYDIFTLKEEHGERSIDVSRYSSALKRHEYIHYAATLQTGYFNQKEMSDLPYDAYFLTNPLIIEPGTIGINSSEDVHKLFHKDHDTMSLQDLEEVKRGSNAIASAYLKVLAEYPEDILNRNLTYNAYVNYSDFLREELHNPMRMVTLYDRKRDTPPSYSMIQELGRQEVREVTTGCGNSGGFAVDEPSSMSFLGPAYMEDTDMFKPFSVIDFAIDSDKYGKRTFKCPHCNCENRRPYNTLIPTCQNVDECGKDVRC